MQRIVDETLRRGRFATHLVAGAMLLALVSACGTDKGVAPTPPPGSVSQKAGLQKLTEFGTVFSDFEFSLYTLDDAGANDDPAQSDLNKFARADNVTGKIGVAWAWDDIDSWTGSGQTGDACALFEIDVGGTTPPDPGLNNADFALCVRITNPDGSAATTVQLPQPESPLLYQCGDKKTDRCTTSFSLVPFNNTQLRCEVLRTGEAVFPSPPINGDDGQDVLAACALDLSLLGNAPIANVKLLNVCSYPSGSPNSNPFDCVVTPGSGFLRIQKVAQGTANTNFGFTLSPAAEDEQTSFTVNPTVEGGLTALIPVDPTKSYTITESTIPAGWDLSSAACGGTTGTGTFVPADKKITGIVVAVGETKICTFTNAQSGSITIVKDATPNDQQDFAFSGNITGCTSFTLDDDAGATGENSTNSNQKVCPVTSGTYSVDETVPSGWVKTSATCSDGSTIGSIDLSPGESVTCTFTNTKQAKLRIVKATNPDADPADFTFTPTNWNGGNTFQRRDNQAAFESAFLAPGTTNYTTTETVPEGWTLSNRECVHTVGGAPKAFTTPTNGITVQLAAGEDVTCTFTNTKGGSITIIKDATPNDQQDFAFSGNIPDCTSFTLDDDGGATGADDAHSNQKACPVTAGTYNVDETVPSGWVKTSATCSDGSAIGSIAVSPGESVTCTFTNTKQAKLRIVKATNPDADPADFTFTPTNWNDGNTFQRRDNQAAFESAFLAPGTTNYTTTETVPEGWTLSNRECVHTVGGAPKTFTTPTNGITVQLAAGEDVTCTFTNTKGGTITIIKDAIPNDQQDFAFAGNITGCTSFTLDDDAGATGASSTNSNQQVCAVVPGTYNVDETVPSGWVKTSATCSDGSAIGSIDVSAGESVTCTFTNTKQAKLRIVKATNPDADPADFTFTPTNWNGGTTFQRRDNQAAFESAFLAPGATDYTTTETVPSAWTLSNRECAHTVGGAPKTFTSPTNGITVQLAAGEDVTCTFTNTRKTGTIKVDKAWVGPGGQTTLKIGTTSGGSEVKSEVTGSAGAAPLTTGAQTVNIGTYYVAESGGLDNYTTSLSCVDGVTPLTIGAGSSVTVAENSAVVCTFTNTRKPKLSITKTPDRDGAGYSVEPGQKAIFTITVSNAADGGAASNVKIEDILPAGVGDWAENPDKTECTITPLNAGEDDRKLACTISTLNTGASFTVTVEAMIPSNFLLKPPSLETTPIEIDGNLADDPDDGAEKDGKDWASLGLNCTSTPKVGCSIDKPTGGTDDSFGNGTKEDTPVPSIVAGQIPNNKSDLLRLYVATQRIVSTDYLYLAWERVQEPSGTTNMDFELNQSDQLSTNGVTPVRSLNDVLITYDLAQGGVTPILGYHRWVLSGACAGNGAKPPCWGPRNELTANVAGAINTGVVVDPINPGADRNLSARTFGEARINLPASGIFGSGICTVFGSAYLKSRSSDSFTAAIKDFIAPVAINVSNCEAKELLNEARAQASNYAPPGGVLNDWFADSGQILVSDETTGSSFRTRSTVREPANGQGSATLRRSRTFFERNDD